MITKLLPKRKKEIRKEIKRIKIVKINKYKVVFLIQIIWIVPIQMILEQMIKIQNRKNKIKKLKIQVTYLTEEITKMVKVKIKKCAIMIQNTHL